MRCIEAEGVLVSCPSGGVSVQILPYDTCPVEYVESVSSWAILSNLEDIVSCASEARLQFRYDPWRLDDKPDTTMMPHTRGQNLDQHIHVHCVSGFTETG